MILHGSIINNKLVLHIDKFCQHILLGIEKWNSQLNGVQAERLNSFLKVKDIFELIKEKN
jgi:hypothetical protein